MLFDKKENWENKNPNASQINQQQPSDNHRSKDETDVVMANEVENDTVLMIGLSSQKNSPKFNEGTGANNMQMEIVNYELKISNNQIRDCQDNKIFNSNYYAHNSHTKANYLDQQELIVSQHKKSLQTTSKLRQNQDTQFVGRSSGNIHQKKSENQTQIEKNEQPETNIQFQLNSQSNEDSLKCVEHYDETFFNQAVQQNDQNCKNSQDNQGLQYDDFQANEEIRQSAKIVQQAIPLQKRVESPFMKYKALGPQMTILSNIYKAKNETIGTILSNTNTHGPYGSKLVSPNYIGLTLNQHQVQFADAVMDAKQFILQPSSTHMNSLRLQKNSVSFSALSPMMTKSPLESRIVRSSRIEKQFESPEHTNKHVYSVNHSNNKMNGFDHSPNHLEHVNNIFSQNLLSQINESPPMTRISSHISKLISAPHVIRTPVKGRFCSPNNVQTCHKEDADPASDPDARFSSNTTKKYRTKTSRGSIIHSNFKINQNSLQKISKHMIKSNNSINRRITYQADSIKKQDELTAQQSQPNHLFMPNNAQSIFFQQYPSIVRVGQVVSAKRNREEQLKDLSAKKFKSDNSKLSSDSGSSSGDESSSNSNESVSSPCTEQTTSICNVPILNQSQQSHIYKYENGLFTATDSTLQNIIQQRGQFHPFDYAQHRGQGFSYQNMQMHNQMHHPYILDLMYMNQVLQEHNNNYQNFNILNQSEFSHHPYHSSANYHVPGCTLKCSCGLWNAQQQIVIPDKLEVRERTNSDISISNHTKSRPFHQPSPSFPSLFPQTSLLSCHSTSQPFNLISSSPFQTNLESTKAQQVHPDIYNSGSGAKKEKRKRRYRERGEEDSQSNIRKRRKGEDKEEWARSQQEQKGQIKTKKAKISRTQQKVAQDFFDVPDQRMANQNKINTKISVYEQQITPQKNQDYLIVNEKAGNKKYSAFHTQLKTMDTLNKNSNAKEQFHLQFTPSSLDKIKIDKYNSNVKENNQHNNIFDKEINYQHHLTSQKENIIILRKEQEDSEELKLKSINLSGKRGGGNTTLKKQLNTTQSSRPHMSSRISIQEKEIQNIKNEEQINIMTDKIMDETVSQEQFFARVQLMEPRVQQCLGCKCKNTKCLKLYCECLRNKATCGPSCQCKQLPDAPDTCNNNSNFIEERKAAIREILKRNIMAFEDKVNKDKSQHFKGCKCKASFCQKKYCECYERNVPCTSKCKCLNCKNDMQCYTHDQRGDDMDNTNEKPLYNESNNQAIENRNDIIINSSMKQSTNPASGFSNRFQQRQFEPDQDLFYTSAAKDRNVMSPIIFDDKEKEMDTFIQSQTEANVSTPIVECHPQPLKQQIKQIKKQCSKSILKKTQPDTGSHFLEVVEDPILEPIVLFKSSPLTQVDLAITVKKSSTSVNKAIKQPAEKIMTRQSKRIKQQQMQIQ